MKALVQDQNGWRYRGSGGPVLFSSKTDYGTTEAVDTIVDRELERASADAEGTAVAYRLSGLGAAPFTDFDLGDGINGAAIDRSRELQRVMSIRRSESAGLVMSTDVECGGRFEDVAARHENWLSSVTPGALMGRADSISATRLGTPVQFGELSTSPLVTVNQTGDLLAELDPDDPEDEGRSDVIEVEDPILIYRTTWSLTQAGDTDTVLECRFDDVAFHWITIPAGEVSPSDVPSSSNGLYTNKVGFPGNRFVLAVTQAGDYARGLVCKVWATSQA